MAWNEPRSWSTGEIVKVGHFNQNLRDNLRLAGRLLARTSYDPGTVTTYTTTSTTLVDVDATNLAVTFTVPFSGKVLVRLCAVAHGAATGVWTLWGLREGAAVVANTATGPDEHAAAAGKGRYTVDLYQTGLTADASKTWKWAFARSVTTGTATMFAGGDEGAATMEVWVGA